MDSTIKSLYTLIIDYCGATFIMQAESESLSNAPSKCIKQWNIQDIDAEFTKSDKAEILSQIESENFVLLDGMKNVWCGSLMLREKLMLLNLILTNSEM